MAVSEEIQEQVLKEATSATPDFSTDYTDERFAQNDQRYEEQKTELDHTYGGMIESTDKFYKDLNDSLKNQADTQAQIQQENTDFAIDLIEQQKEQAQKDYIKEQSGAYGDWQKQSNPYGVNAEKMASAGLDKSGYSESSQVSMYNTYQNRVATARETLQRVIQEYNNNINQAILQNNAALAQIYADLSVQQTQLALEGFQYKNQLVENLADRKIQLESDHWQRELAIMQQQNWENQMAEEYRQFESNQKFTAEQNALDRQHQEKLQTLQQEFTAAQAELDRQHDKAMADLEQKYKIDYLNASTEKEKELLKIQHQNDIAKLNQQLANEKAILKYEYDLKAQNATKISSSSGGSSSGSSGTKISGSSGSSSKSSSTTIRNVGGGSFGTSTIKSLNMQSILNLGYGPISESYLAKLVSEGKVRIVNKNGVGYAEKVVQLPSVRR